MSSDETLPLIVDEWMPARRSLRVAVVTETYPPEVNGVAATIARVVEGLRQRGHELQLVRPRQHLDAPAGRFDSAVERRGMQGSGARHEAGIEAGSEAGSEAEGDQRFVEVLLRGLPIPRYPQLKMGMPSKRALVRLWSQRRPDVVHVVTEGPLGWSALQAAKTLKLPVVSDFRTNFHAYSRHYGIAWLHNPIMGYLRKFHNRAACTMVPTEALKQQLGQAGFQRLKVVARGVDTRLFDPARRSAALRAQWGADDDTLVVLCVGRLAPEKNLGVLFDAFAAMRAQRPTIRLVLVGDGPARGALQARQPQAVFAGTQRGEALAAHYASADAFVFPSLTETFGNVIPEAMASGLAVLAHDYAAAGQLVTDGESGLLARYDDPAHFVRRAQQLAADLAPVRAMGRRAREVAQRMDWDRIIGLVEAEYDTALSAVVPTSERAFAPPLPVR